MMGEVEEFDGLGGKAFEHCMMEVWMTENGSVTRLLRSRWHQLLNGNILLIAVTGCKSGRPIRLPVNYIRGGGELWIVSSRDAQVAKMLKASLQFIPLAAIAMHVKKASDGWHAADLAQAAKTRLMVCVKLQPALTKPRGGAITALITGE